MEVPEIFNGVVEIKAVSREAGSAPNSRYRHMMKTSMPLGPVSAPGAPVWPESWTNSAGRRSTSSNTATNRRNSSPPPSPAKVLSVEVDPDGAKSCRATVPDSQLSLAIGNKGQNARLAAKLTGWKIDIRPESGFYGEEDA